MKKIEIFNSVFFILLGCFFLYLTREMKPEYYTIGPGFFPRMIAGLLILANITRLLLIVFRIERFDARIVYDDKPLYAAAGIFALYAVGNYIIGFTISSLAFLYVMMDLLGNRSLLQKTVTPVAVTLGVKAIFKWVLVLPLPAGFWNIL